MESASRAAATRPAGTDRPGGVGGAQTASPAPKDASDPDTARAPALPPALQHPPVQVAEPTRQQKVLIVDDIEANLVAMERTLTALGAELVCVTSGEQALRATLSNDFAAAIIDVQMPGMDGYELAEHLRSDARTADMPILFVSANYAQEHHIFRGYSAGAVDFMTKPLKPEVLLGKLRFS